MCSVVLVMILGMGFRSLNLDQKAYWVDEVHTAVRITGYTKADITAERFDNHVHAVTDLNIYQIPAADPSLMDVLDTLAHHPEHPPLYYLLARWWMQSAIALGHSPSVTVTRSLSLLFSLLALPCVVALTRELFRSNLTAIIALSIFALSPLHILYGQEAREYSLWTLVTLLSCWTFLRAIRLPTLKNWVLYGLTLTLGWYSHLLFTTVAIAHTFYFFLFAAPATNPSQDSDDALRVANASYSTAPLPKSPFLLTLTTSLILFFPWIAVFLNQFGQIQTVVEATQREPSLGYLLNVWGRNLSRVWFSGDLGSVNLLVVLGVVFSLIYLWQTVPKPVSGFLLLLIGVNALALMVPDLITGGISSTRIRYLLPAYGGLQLAIAHLFAHQITQNKPGWKIGLIGVLISGAIVGCINTTQVTNWAKSDKSAYYPKMAEVINASDHPLVITDNSATYTLVLAHQLNEHVYLQLVDLQRLQRAKDLIIPNTIDGEAISDLFLFAPSPPLRRQLEKRVEKRAEAQPEKTNFEPFTSVVRQSDRFQLLHSSRALANRGGFRASIATTHRHRRLFG